MNGKFNIGTPLLKTLLKEYRHSIRETIQSDLDVLPSMVNGDKIHTLTDEYVVISNMIRDIDLCLAKEYAIVPIFVDNAIEHVGTELGQCVLGNDE